MAAKDNSPELYPRTQLHQVEQPIPIPVHHINNFDDDEDDTFRNPTPAYNQQYTHFNWSKGDASNEADLDNFDEREEIDPPFEDQDDLGASSSQPNIPSNSVLSNIMSQPFDPSVHKQNREDPHKRHSPSGSGNNSQGDNEFLDDDDHDRGNGGQNTRPKPRKFKLDTIEECEYVLPPFHRGFRVRPNQVFLFDYKFDFRTGKAPDPYPDKKKSIDVWDENHVKMPNSLRNERKKPPGFFSSSAYSLVPTWRIIEKALKKKICSFRELDEIIKKYNNYNNFTFDVLREFLEKTNPPNVYEVLNKMAKLALKLPEVVTQSPPLLKQKRNTTVFMTQKQIACLLANAFFCTFPRRSRKNDEYKDYPLFNFVSLFSSKNKNDANERKIKIEKIKCIFNYFQRVLQEKPKGVVTFERRHLDKSPEWDKCTKTLRKLQIEESGTIEREGRKYSEIEFANKYIGGGVIKNGTLQEEIRLLISPELIVSRLFTQALLDNEALIITGTVQHNIVQGYGNSFKWIGDMRDHPSKDVWNRHYTEIIAIDAQEFHSNDVQKQFEKNSIDRALNKAFCGFKTYYKFKNNKNPAIASGKWGCGDFNGDPYLSCVIQFMAASFADRDLKLFLKNDRKLVDKLVILNNFCYEKRLKIKDLYNVLISYQYESQSVRNTTNVVDFICNKNYQ